MRTQTTTTREEQVSDTEIVVYQEREIKEVVFKKGTPGLIVSFTEDGLMYDMINYKLAFAKEGPAKKYSYSEIQQKLNQKPSDRPKEVKPGGIITYHPFLMMKKTLLERIFKGRSERRVVAGETIDKEKEVFF